MRTAILVLGSLVLAGCGGNVVVDGQSDPGAGGAASSPSSSSSSSSASSSTGQSCLELPLIHSPCSAPGLLCPVPFGCCGGNAFCNEDGLWKYQSFECNEACKPCGEGLSCAGGAICVDYQSGFLESFGCRQDPCPGVNDCDCIKSICKESGLSCQSHGPTLLVCDCPSC